MRLLPVRLLKKPLLLNLHSVLLMVSLIALLLPLLGLHFLKIYESALVRQTESELISQSAFIGAAYKKEISDLLIHELRSPYRYGNQLPRMHREEFYQASIDLTRDKLLPPRPGGMPGPAADPLAAQAGAQISPILQDAQKRTLSGMKVLDYRGIQVAGQQEMGMSFANLPEVQQAFRGLPKSTVRKRILHGKRPSLSSNSRGADINVFVSAPIIMNDRLIGVVLVNRTPTDLAKALYAKRKDILWGTMIILLVTLGIAGITSYTITRPIYALVAQARKIEEGDMKAAEPLENPVTREFAILSESFAGMAKTIEHRSEYIRQFAMHVSHEFKTPLTAIQGSIELLQEHIDEMPPEQRDRFLNNIAQDTERLKRLVTRLLELARADTLMPVSGETGLLQVLEPLVERYKDLGLKIALENPAGRELHAAIAPDALEAVVTNLLDNSRQHGADQMRIGIIPQENTVHIRLQDNGTGITPANAAQVFTPFFTTNREKGGTGLGLSIVQSLLKAYDAQIQLLPDSPGAVFLITMQLVAATQ